MARRIARTQSPTNKNYALELPTFGVIVGVSPTGVQWKGLTLEEPPSWSWFTSVPGKYALGTVLLLPDPSSTEHFFAGHCRLFWSKPKPTKLLPTQFLVTTNWSNEYSSSQWMYAGRVGGAPLPSSVGVGSLATWSCCWGRHTPWLDMDIVSQHCGRILPINNTLSHFQSINLIIVTRIECEQKGCQPDGTVGHQCYMCT